MEVGSFIQFIDSIQFETGNYLFEPYPVTSLAEKKKEITEFLDKNSANCVFRLLSNRPTILVRYPVLLQKALVLSQHNNGFPHKNFLEKETCDDKQWTKISPQLVEKLNENPPKDEPFPLQIATLIELLKQRKKTSKISGEYLFSVLDYAWQSYEASVQLILTSLQTQYLNSKLIVDCIEYWTLFVLFSFLLDRIYLLIDLVGPCSKADKEQNNANNVKFAKEFDRLVRIINSSSLDENRKTMDQQPYKKLQTLSDSLRHQLTKKKSLK